MTQGDKKLGLGSPLGGTSTVIHYLQIFGDHFRVPMRVEILSARPCWIRPPNVSPDNRLANTRDLIKRVLARSSGGSTSAGLLSLLPYGTLPEKPAREVLVSCVINPPRRTRSFQAAESCEALILTR